MAVRYQNDSRLEDRFNYVVAVTFYLLVFPTHRYFSWPTF